MKKIDFSSAAECLKTIAHPCRLQMIHYLLENETASVGELADICQLKSHVASEHLTLLKDRGFISSVREGRNVIYSIREHALSSIMNCIEKKFSQ